MITVDKENGQIKVERILYDDDEEVDEEEKSEPKKVPLEQIDLKRYKVKYEGGELKTTEIRDGLQIAKTIVDIGAGINRIVTDCLPFCVEM